MAENDLAADFLDGVPAIAAFLGLPLRRVYELAEKKRIPVFKLGDGKWLARKSTLRRYVERLEQLETT
jgi:excisionase family DNA binding protein